MSMLFDKTYHANLEVETNRAYLALRQSKEKSEPATNFLKGIFLISEIFNHQGAEYLLM